jgi:hypothetical protein
MTHDIQSSLFFTGRRKRTEGQDGAGEASAFPELLKSPLPYSPFLKYFDRPVKIGWYLDFYSKRREMSTWIWLTGRIRKTEHSTSNIQHPMMVIAWVYP